MMRCSDRKWLFYIALSLFTIHCSLFLASCGNLQKQTRGEAVTVQPVGPAFNADSAYLYCQ